MTQFDLQQVIYYTCRVHQDIILHAHFKSAKSAEYLNSHLNALLKFVPQEMHESIKAQFRQIYKQLAKN